MRCFDSEFDDSDSSRIEMTLGEEPLFKIVRAGDRAREVTLEDEGVSRVSSRFPSIVSFVMKVLCNSFSSAHQ